MHVCMYVCYAMHEGIFFEDYVCMRDIGLGWGGEWSGPLGWHCYLFVCCSSSGMEEGCIIDLR